jgi:hypothetical protein
MSKFGNKTCFFQKSVFGRNFFFWRNELTCGLRKVQNTIHIFLSKVWRPKFFLCSICCDDIYIGKVIINFQQKMSC